jgi:hypothetical protein
VRHAPTKIINEALITTQEPSIDNDSQVLIGSMALNNHKIDESEK